MQRERVSENVYWFQSDIYAQVTAGAITGPQWAVVIDTLAMPEETLAMRAFIEEQLGVPVRYIVNTHYHADHVWGNCFFPGATIISSSLCRRLIQEIGKPSLEATRQQNPVFRQVKIVLPHLTFSDGGLTLRVGKKNLVMFATPGHSRDAISVLVEEDRVLFAGDAFLPLPLIVDGDYDDLVHTLKHFSSLGLENIVQGHGDIVLRGEIEEAVKSNLEYLNLLRKNVKSAMKKKYPYEVADSIEIEACGKSRVLLGGLANTLHQRNVRFLLKKLAEDEGIVLNPGSSEDEYEDMDD